MEQSLENKHFEFNIRVYYEDTDAGGIVYYANYLKFFERARTELIRSLGLNQKGLAETENILFVVKEVSISYKKPAHLDDYLNIHTITTKIGGSSIIFEQQALRNNELLAQAQVIICTVDGTSFRPTRINSNIRQLLLKGN